MFPDSEIAKQMKLQRTKISYVINFGLANYFFRKLQTLCFNSEFLVLGFDESFNKVAQKGKMDLFVRFWDPVLNQVFTRFYGSSFLHHATTEDLMEVFSDATVGINLS